MGTGEIAVIARNRRNLKGKISPLIAHNANQRTGKF
jgi:hypothetical protein